MRVTDLMPIADDRADIVRRVEGSAAPCGCGTSGWCGSATARSARGCAATHGPDGTTTRSSPPSPAPTCWSCAARGCPTPRDGRHVDEFDVAAGEELTFSTTWFASHAVPEPLGLRGQHRGTTREQWQDWADRCDYEGPYRDAVVRSLLVLRLLTHADTGGIVAAPTTSLPEEFGGERNWDYRFFWLRDASLTLEALLESGFAEEAKLWRGWLLRAIAGDPEDMQIMYGVDGERDLPERELDHLPGYAGSRPVRVGNGAVEQCQTDVLGEVMMALCDGRDRGLDETELLLALQRALVEELAEHWDEPDNGIWEIRGPLRHFTHSRVMVWAAFDRAISGVEKHGLDGPVERWRSCATQVARRGAGQGVRRGARHLHPVLRHHRGGRVAAAHPESASCRRTTRGCSAPSRAIEEDLCTTGCCCATAPSGVDGLPGDEHPFLACSFWLVQAYAAGRAARRGARADGPARRARQRRRAAVRGVRPDGRTGWSATSRRRSRTWPSSARRTPSPGSLR